MSTPLPLAARCLPFLLPFLFCASQAKANLLANEGFEDPAMPGWYLSAPSAGNTAELISDDVHAGQSAVKLTATVPEAAGKAVQVYSDLVAVAPGSLVEASLWLKADSVAGCGDPADLDCVGWYQLRATLYAFDINNDPIRHSDFISTDGDVCLTGTAGNCQWKQVRTRFLAPDNTATMRIAIMLTTSTGTVWVDDVTLDVIQPMPTLDLSSQTQPVLIPPPWKVTVGNDNLSLGSVAVLNTDGQPRLQQEIEDFLTARGISHFINPSDPSQYTTQLLLGDSSNATISARLNTRYPDNSWVDMGDEGYFISVDNEAGNRILLGANSERGRFYGVQTLKQLIDNGRLHVADILDRPQLDRRGTVLGLQWLRSANQPVAIQRLTELKGNMSWTQGSYLNGKFLWNWDEPFTAGELTAMQNNLALADSKFVDLHISFGPRIRRWKADGVNTLCDEQNYPAPVFSDTATAGLVVGKMLALYDLGYRNFGINFDDATHCNEDRLRHAQDITAFADDIGVAHVFFVNQVFSQLTAVHTDVNMMFIPLWYSSTGNSNIAAEDYIAALQGLDPAIELHTVQTFDENVDTLISLAQRPTMIWSNFFARNKDVIYTMPYISGMNWDPAKLTGFIFLPALPDTATQNNEDEALVSWNTALSYAWAPDSYDPLELFNRTGARYEGGIPDPVPVVSKPIIGPTGGTFTRTQPVTLATTTPGTEIFYSLDGSTPVNDGSSSSSMQYAGDLVLTTTGTLSVRGFRAGFIDSAVATAQFELTVVDVDRDGIADSDELAAGSDPDQLFSPSSRGYNLSHVSDYSDPLADDSQFASDETLAILVWSQTIGSGANAHSYEITGGGSVLAAGDLANIGDGSYEVQMPVAALGYTGNDVTISFRLQKKKNKYEDSVVVSVPGNVVGTPPTVAISAPADGSSHASGASIGFTATAGDAEDGDLGSSISWSSDLEGPIGSGAGIGVVLIDGSHTITAGVTDSDGNTSNSSINITVGSPADCSVYSDKNSCNADAVCRWSNRNKVCLDR